jgi:hypothetical protein
MASISSYIIIKLIPARKFTVFLTQNAFLLYLLLTLDSIK